MYIQHCAKLLAVKSWIQCQTEAVSNSGGDWLLDSQFTPLSLGQTVGQALRVPRRRRICSDFGWSQPGGRETKPTISDGG